MVLGTMEATGVDIMEDITADSTADITIHGTMIHGTSTHGIMTRSTITCILTIADGMEHGIRIMEQ